MRMRVVGEQFVRTQVDNTDFMCYNRQRRWLTKLVVYLNYQVDDFKRHENEFEQVHELTSFFFLKEALKRRIDKGENYKNSRRRESTAILKRQ